VHTGQHYDFNMSDAFFRDLGLPVPAHNLGVGSGSHAEQTGGVMIAYEKICMASRPDVIVVVGDVNSTAACAMVGTKLWIPVVHLEAGLRSRDRRMPEEINRLVTDAIADVLWTPSIDADENLRGEGIAEDKITMIGNIMIDSFELLRGKIESSKSRDEHGLRERDFAVVTLHRPSNVDDNGSLTTIVEGLTKVSKHTPLAFVVHPRTRKNLARFGLYERMAENPDIVLVDPLPYIDFMGLATQARFVITDSGGLQEETTYLGIPCLTLRENTERPITITQGTNRLVKPGELLEAVEAILSGDWSTGSRPAFWDGNAAQRATEDLSRRLALD
jgi:UDP-N-acetylglucosamine 2-epimerase (non-hydrolysing)